MRFTLILCLAASSLAAPTNFLNDAYNWSDDLADFYGKVSLFIDNIRHNIKTPSTCDISKIVLPSDAAGLTSPNGLKPLAVTLGRGTQVCIYPGPNMKHQTVLITTTELYLRRLHIQLGPCRSRSRRKTLQCHMSRSQLPSHPGKAPQHSL